MPHKDDEARRAYQREYQRKWRAANLEKARAISREHEERHREERRAARRAYYAAHADEIKARKAASRDPAKAHEYYLANKEKINTRVRAYRAANPEAARARNKAWYEANRDRKLALDRQWREANKDAIDAKRKARQWELKQEVWSQYGGAECSCCGVVEREFLTIDHINGGGAKHRKELRRAGSQSIYNWLKKQGYPDGYRVLCINCNWASGLYGSCPHQSRMRTKT